MSNGGGYYVAPQMPTGYVGIGICSLCAGTVVAFQGPYFGRPPGPYCQSCGAVPDDRPQAVIPMRREPTFNTTGNNISPTTCPWCNRTKTLCACSGAIK